MEMLEKAGLTEETILIITSDHGMPWPRGKGSLYDMGTRVPLIVRWRKMNIFDGLCDRWYTSVVTWWGLFIVTILALFVLFSGFVL